MLIISGERRETRAGGELESEDEIFYDARAYPIREGHERSLFVLTEETKRQMMSKRDEIKNWLRDTNPEGGFDLMEAIPLMVLGCSMKAIDEALWTLLSKLCEQFNLQYHTVVCGGSEDDVSGQKTAAILRKVKEQPFVSGLFSEVGVRPSREAVLDSHGGVAGSDLGPVGDLLRLRGNADRFLVRRAYLLAAYLRSIVLLVSKGDPLKHPIWNMCWKAHVCMQYLLSFVEFGA